MTSFLLGNLFPVHQIDVLIETLSNEFSHFLPIFHGKINILLKLREVVGTNWCFERIAVGNVAQKNSSSSCSFEISYSEHTTIVSEDFCLHGNYLGKYSGFVVACFPYFIARSVQKHILLHRMPMHIKEKYQSWLVLLLQTYHQLLHSLYLRNQERRAIFELPVEIFAIETCSKIPWNDSIYIQHWYHLEDNILSQISCILFIRSNEFQKTIQGMTATGFSWMNSTPNQNTLFGGIGNIGICYG